MIILLWPVLLIGAALRYAQRLDRLWRNYTACQSEPPKPPTPNIPCEPMPSAKMWWGPDKPRGYAAQHVEWTGDNLEEIVHFCYGRETIVPDRLMERIRWNEAILHPRTLIIPLGGGRRFTLSIGDCLAISSRNENTVWYVDMHSTYGHAERMRLWFFGHVQFWGQLSDLYGDHEWFRANGELINPIIDNERTRK